MFHFFRQRKNKPERSEEAPPASDLVDSANTRLIAAITAAILCYRSSSNHISKSGFIVKRIRRI